MTEEISNIFATVVFCGLTLFGVYVIYLSRRHDGQHNRSGCGLWDELARAHDLSRQETRLLRKAAEKGAVDPMTLVFIDPHVLRSFAAGAASQKRGRNVAGELVKKLFS